MNCSKRWLAGQESIFSGFENEEDESERESVALISRENLHSFLHSVLFSHSGELSFTTIKISTRRHFVFAYFEKKGSKTKEESLSFDLCLRAFPRRKCNSFSEILISASSECTDRVMPHIRFD